VIDRIGKFAYSTDSGTVTTLPRSTSSAERTIRRLVDRLGLPSVGNTLVVQRVPDDKEVSTFRNDDAPFLQTARTPAGLIIEWGRWESDEWVLSRLSHIGGVLENQEPSGTGGPSDYFGPDEAAEIFCHYLQAERPPHSVAFRPVPLPGS